MKEKHLFLVSSAVNTKFGWYSPYGRLCQVRLTVNSIVERIPDAKVIIIESSGIQLTESDLTALRDISHYVIDFSSNPDLQAVHDETDYWDGVKNLCEITCFNLAMKQIDQLLETDLKDVTRIHKISGRYVLNENFNKYLYEVETDRIIFSKRIDSQFTDDESIGISKQLMSRLWSWPRHEQEEIKNFYKQALKKIVSTYKKGEYVDIEHLLFKYFKNNKKILEVPKIGVEGNVAGNGKKVSD